MSSHTAKCPACGSLIPNGPNNLRGPWTCPICEKNFRIPHWYAQVLSWGALGIAFSFWWFLSGLHGFQLFVIVLATILPTYSLFRSLPGKIIPTPLEPYPPEALERFYSAPPPFWRIGPFKCPVCHFKFATTYVSGQAVVCSNCSGEFRIARWYEPLISLSALGFAFVLSHLLGFHGAWLAIAAAVFWFPGTLAETILLGRIVPIPLQPYAAMAVKCPLCEKPVPLPANWNLPFPCPSCGEQLRGRMRFEGVLGVVFLAILIPQFFFLWIDGILATVVIFVVVSMALESFLPVDVLQYDESQVTTLKL